jgi:dsRNA-specific ribonuclease
MNDEYKKNPYNSNNKLISLNEINKILKKYGIDKKASDLNLYQKAFVHKSYMRTKYKDISLDPMPDSCSIDLFDECNERIEYLGDSILGAIISNYNYERYEDEDEGFLSKMKTKIVNGKKLAELSEHLGFGEWAIISNYAEENNEGRSNTKILEDIFESFIGAIFLDFNNTSSINKNEEIIGMGFQYCNNFIRNVIETHIDFTELIINEDNYKDLLSKIFTQNYQCKANYCELSCEGSGKEKIYTMGVKDNQGRLIGKGINKNKRAAEQIAAKEALIKLGAIYN